MQMMSWATRSSGFIQSTPCAPGARVLVDRPVRGAARETCVTARRSVHYSAGAFARVHRSLCCSLRLSSDSANAILSDRRRISEAHTRMAFCNSAVLMLPKLREVLPFLIPTITPHDEAAPGVPGAANGYSEAFGSSGIAICGVGFVGYFFDGCFLAALAFLSAARS